MLTLYRRHLKSCEHRLVGDRRTASTGRRYTKCSCPIWCDGQVNGKHIRQSMNTRDWARATRNLAAIEDPNYGLRACIQPGCQTMVKDGRCTRHTRALPAAIAAYHVAHQDVGSGTKRNRRRTLRYLGEFLESRGVKTVDQIDLDTLNMFRPTRELSPRSWVKELEILRHFFRFCLDNEWTLRNPAAKLQMPRNLKSAEREPYEPNEITRMIAACDGIGRAAYERLRARAMVLMLRYTALRISDVATLKRDRIRGGEIFIRTAKNGKPVKLPIHPELQAALNLLPLPRGAAGQECPYFFWSGNGSTKAVIRDATRTMASVFEASGVPGACSHRFRHTLATEVLEAGGSIEEAADILGDSPSIIAKHYAKWSSRRQARITDLLGRIWAPKDGLKRDAGGTRKSSDSQNQWNDEDRLVDGMGFEPTTPALRTPCSPN